MKVQNVAGTWIISKQIGMFQIIHKASWIAYKATTNNMKPLQFTATDVRGIKGAPNQAQSLQFHHDHGGISSLLPRPKGKKRVTTSKKPQQDEGKAGFAAPLRCLRLT